VKLVGIDIGGTFTDLALYDSSSDAVVVHKVRSTPDDPGRALVSGIVELCERGGINPDTIDGVLHGTTVATNAVLEHRGARTGMVTTEGMRDIVHIGRHQRPQPYSVMQDIPWQSRPFVERAHRVPVAGRIAPPMGAAITPLDEDAVRAAGRQLRDAGVEAIAVCFLFSYLDPTHEERAAEILREEAPDCFVTTSASISPQFREFERFTTACMNAFVGPGTGRYLERLTDGLKAEGVEADLLVMRSNGGVASVAEAAERPVTLMLSGPAAGVLGAQWAAGLVGRKRLITFDMGGTSADIGLVTETGINEASARDTHIADYPLLVPMFDIETIGAGGGSIAHVDAAGAFKVGPRSAGPHPDPRVTATAATSRRSPTRTSSSAASTPTASWAARCRWRSRAPRRSSTGWPASSGWSAWRRRRGSSPWPTPTWRRPSARSRSSAGATRASSRSSPSAAQARCTPPSWRRCSACPKSSSPHTRASPRPPGC
jgi:N-methylhydantoinase A